MSRDDFLREKNELQQENLQLKDQLEKLKREIAEVKARQIRVGDGSGDGNTIIHPDGNGGTIAMKRPGDLLEQSQPPKFSRCDDAQ